MTKLSPFSAVLIFSAAVFINGLATNTSAQDLKVRIEVLPESSRAIIEGQTKPRTDWSFRDSYGSVIGLANRMEKFELRDGKGNPVDLRRLAPGQFTSRIAAGHFKYEMKLSPPAMPADSALASWVTKERGLLMLADLLPLISENGRLVSASVAIESPGLHSVGYSQTKVIFTQPPDADGIFRVSNVETAVFAIGSHIRSVSAAESGLDFEYITDGDWAFTDDEAIALVRQVLRAHRQVLGGMPATRASLIVFPFPQNAGASQWAAETRGQNVTLLIGKLPSKVAALTQLSTPLTHELFHLWVPNALDLKGDYDWFYEGFTMYEVTQIAVRLRLLTFQEFLNAIGRANDVYRADQLRDRWSLIEASKRRWTGGASSVYSKSMMVAFLFDLKLRESGNKRGLDSIYQRLFAKYRMIDGPSHNAGDLPDGNDAIVDLLKGEREPALFTEPVIIDLKGELAPFGLLVDDSGARTRVMAADRLSKRQRDLLSELGYNAATHSAR